MEIKVKVRLKTIIMEEEKFTLGFDPIEQEKRHGKPVFRVEVSQQGEKEDSIQKWWTQVKPPSTGDLQQEDFVAMILLPLPEEGMLLEKKCEEKFFRSASPLLLMNRDMWLLYSNDKKESRKPEKTFFLKRIELA